MLGVKYLTVFVGMVIFFLPYLWVTATLAKWCIRYNCTLHLPNSIKYDLFFSIPCVYFTTILLTNFSTQSTLMRFGAEILLASVVFASLFIASTYLKKGDITNGLEVQENN